MVKIGNIQLPDRPVFLAPLEGVTDRPFRQLCRQFGADMVYTEFISSEALIREVNKSKQKMRFEGHERPIGIQLYGNKVESLVEAARMAELAEPDLIDLNFGCPVKKVALKGGGSGLLRDIPLLLSITREVVRATRLPVTVKTRLGWDAQNLIIEDLAERLQDEGIAALTIHGRTRNQMYLGEADWTLIGKVKNNPRMRIPIIGNGDIQSAAKAKLMFDQYGVDAVMVGRASIGKPYIFREIKRMLTTGEACPPPSLSEQIAIFREYLYLSIAEKGLPGGILHLRRHIAQMFKGLSHFRETRIQLLRTDSLEELESLLDRVNREYGEDQP